ncbi:MAG: hypothetical protein K940chlam7_00348 [Chlamydiae bacterium]|nr:hypothetical protein [Chlamydiota bacterium]
MTINYYKSLKKKSEEYTPSELASLVGFDEGLRISRGMLNNDEWDETLQEYAANLLEELRKKYPIQWNSSWKFDAFLGYAYHIILKYDERYAAYKRAVEKITPPPPQLLIAMARCCWAPGVPPITEEEAISLVKQALSKTIYYEGASLLRGLYKATGNAKEQAHWEVVLKNMEGKEVCLPSLDEVFDT